MSATILSKSNLLLGKTYESKRGSGVIAEVMNSKHYSPQGTSYVVRVEQQDGGVFFATVVIADNDELWEEM